ncbi:MAG: carbohydrate binding domain-containing protein [Phycisphaeraceae bacterium]
MDERRGPRRGHRVRRGFTLVETILAVVIVSLTVVAALASVAAVARTERIGLDSAQGHFLAQLLMSEVLACHYSDLSFAPGSFGLGAGESQSDRTTLNDIDDYHGLVESPVTYADGTAVPGAAGWSRRVSVTRVNGSTLGLSGSDTGLRKIVVQAVSPTGAVTELQTLMNLNSNLSERGLYERTVPAVARVRIRSGDANKLTLAAALPLLNEPTATTNLLKNPGWESGASNWYSPETLQAYFDLNGITVSGGLYREVDAACDLEIKDDGEEHSGAFYLKTKSRSWNDTGPAQVITDVLQVGATYYTEVWASTDDTQRVYMVLLYGDDKGDYRLETSRTRVVEKTGWKRVAGSFTVPSITGSLRYAVWRVETNLDRDILFDDAVLR